MEFILAGLLFVGLVISLCILAHAAKKAKDSANNVIRIANDVLTDMNKISSELLEVSREIDRLRDALYDVEEDVIDE